MVLRTAREQNCLTALFLGKIDIVLKKCKCLNGSFDPVWIRSPDSSYWIYSFCAPQQVTVLCQEIGFPRNPKTNSVGRNRNSTELTHSSSCSIHDENYHIL